MEYEEELGVSIPDDRPRALDPSPASLSKYFVLVSLDGPIEQYVPSVPFHTSVLEWDVGSRPDGLVGDALKVRYEELYREVSAHLRDLVETLRGEEIPT